MDPEVIGKLSHLPKNVWGNLRDVQESGGIDADVFQRTEGIGQQHGTVHDWPNAGGHQPEGCADQPAVCTNQPAGKFDRGVTESDSGTKIS